MEEALFLKEVDNDIYIRAIGHITAALCPELRTRVFGRLEAKPPVDDMYIDLGQCSYMDSTFMGLLVGFNKRFLRFSERPITLIHTSGECLSLLKTIGILKLVILSDEDLPFPPAMENLVSTEPTTVDLLLDVHENLMEISEDNRRRFSTLHAILRSQKRKDDQA
ncbi:MAG: STAS domain-containing protein [Spirochaetes bacterium]|nr:STAS domain-containing protein [Spirochaetota bacterium]